MAASRAIPLRSSIRALVQAELALGRIDEAERLARRIEACAEPGSELTGWLALSASLFVARARGDHDAIEEIASRMRERHRRATEYFLDGDRMNLVWY